MFARDEKGSIAIPAAIGGLVMIAAIGAAFDTARLVTERHTLQSIADAAALAATVPENISQKQRRELAQNSITDYLQQTGEALDVSMPVFKVADAGEKVSVTLSSQKDLVFGGIIGMSNYTVIASSSAAEFTETMGAARLTSISFVVGFSEGRQDRNSKRQRMQPGQVSHINMVKSALNSVLGGQAADSLETAFYPFNWGTVDERVSPLQPGSAATLQALQYTMGGEGNVPGPALESAIQEQSNQGGDAKRIVVFLTDGNVDNEKADEQGQYLAVDQVDDASNSAACKDAEKEVKQSKNHLENTNKQAINSFGRVGDNAGNNSSLLPGLRYVSVDEPVDQLLDQAWQTVEIIEPIATPGSNRIPRILADIEELQVAEMNRSLACEAKQTMRVVEACADAKDDNLSLVAIDFSGEEDKASEVLELCTGLVVNDDYTADDRTEDNPNKDIVGNVRVLPDGGEIHTSEDGKTVSAKVSNVTELRAVLQELLPKNAQTTTTRTVRLVR